MPVGVSSRYRALEPIEAADARGARHATLPIRLHQAGPPALAARRLTAPETLEYLAWRYFQSSHHWWRIADANRLRFPLDWEPGEAVAMPSLEPLPAHRTRRF